MFFSSSRPICFDSICILQPILQFLEVELMWSPNKFLSERCFFTFFLKGGAENIFIESPETHYQVEAEKCQIVFFYIICLNIMSNSEPQFSRKCEIMFFRSWSPAKATGLVRQKM